MTKEVELMYASKSLVSKIALQRTFDEKKVFVECISQSPFLDLKKNEECCFEFLEMIINLRFINSDSLLKEFLGKSIVEILRENSEVKSRERIFIKIFYHFLAFVDSQKELNLVTDKIINQVKNDVVRSTVLQIFSIKKVWIDDNS